MTTIAPSRMFSSRILVADDQSAVREALREPPDGRKDELVSIVAYAVKRRIASGKPDYWDYATLLELAVIGEDEAAAWAALGDALAAIREVWEPETTVRNLRLIREARERRGVAKPWMLQIETELAKKPPQPAG